jgi:hypothetical protein
MSIPTEMTADQLNPTPKAKFQSEEANVKAHHALLESPAFEYAEQVAMLQFSRSLAKELETSGNPQLTGMVNGFKLLGVQQFMAEFRMLAEKGTAPQPPGVARTLDHKN